MTRSHCYTNYDNVVNISGRNIMIFVYTYKQSQKITESNFTHKMYKCIFLLTFIYTVMLYSALPVNRAKPSSKVLPKHGRSYTSAKIRRINVGRSCKLWFLYLFCMQFKLYLSMDVILFNLILKICDVRIYFVLHE